MSDRATDYSPSGNAVCAREAHQYIITHLPAFVNLACSQITLTITTTSKVVGLRETHTHVFFLDTHILILSYMPPHAPDFRWLPMIADGGGRGSTPGRTRTFSLRIRSPLLYPLSYRCIILYRLYFIRTWGKVNVSRCHHTIYVQAGRPPPPKSLRHKGLRQAVISPFTTGTTAVTSGAWYCPLPSQFVP